MFFIVIIFFTHSVANHVFGVYTPRLKACVHNPLQI